MSAFLKTIIMLVIWFLFTFLVFRSCSDELCTGCADGAATDVTDTSQFTRYPIDFQWSDATAFTNAGFESYRDSLLELGKGMENGVLQITGLYYEAEPKPEGFDNMGFARAAQVKELFANEVDSIYLRAALIPEAEGVREGYFKAARFEWITSVVEGVIDTMETAETEADTGLGEDVPDVASSFAIRFPFGSTQKTEDPAVDAYLDRLAERVKQTGERITLTGHTDNVGSDESNMTLGRNRANAIRDLLVQKGVSENLITVNSRGENQPTDTNTTEEGRHNNRRVEVRLIKE
jgi:outer membrane protein OmpA-like peptidoglycan-associated protein